MHWDLFYSQELQFVRIGFMTHILVYLGKSAKGTWNESLLCYAL